MKKEETKFKEKLLKRLKEIPGLWYVKVQQVCLRSTMDIIICYKGKFIGYELKVEGGKLDKLQQYTLNKVSFCGGIARVVTPSNYISILKEDFNWEELNIQK